MLMQIKTEKKGKTYEVGTNVKLSFMWILLNSVKVHNVSVKNICFNICYRLTTIYWKKWKYEFVCWI